METELIMRLNIGSIISICTIASLLLLSVVSSAIPTTLIISFDGFRWDYIHKTNNIPNFNHVIHTGGWSVKGTKNVFLTKTLPNHYTLVTGLYEESHGLVGNAIYDPHLNETYHLENRTKECESKWFDNGGEPIWVTNQRQSTQHRTGSLFWPGSCARVKGFVPYRFLGFDITVEFKKRVDIIVDWFNDEYPINLGLLYFDDPDHTGHIYGPDSPQIIQKIEELDNVLGYLFEKLQNISLLENMNIIITSDHGMTSTPNDGHHQIDLNKYISRDSYDITSSSPVAAIRPKSKELETEIFKNLSNILNLHVYRKEDIPDDYHFKHNDRIQPILAEPSEHYWISIDSNSTNPEGNHGYNNSLETMHPVFMAMGPAFRAGSKVSTFNAVDVYPLMCHILGLIPAPNNGSLDHVRPLLKLVDTSQGGTSTFTSYIVILLFAVLVGGVYGVAACRVQRQYKRHNLHQRSISDFKIPSSVRFSTLDKDSKRLLSESSEDEFDGPIIP